MDGRTDGLMDGLKKRKEREKEIHGSSLLIIPQWVRTYME